VCDISDYSSTLVGSGKKRQKARTLILHLAVGANHTVGPFITNGILVAPPSGKTTDRIRKDQRGAKIVRTSSITMATMVRLGLRTPSEDG